MFSDCVRLPVSYGGKRRFLRLRRRCNDTLASYELSTIGYICLLAYLSISRFLILLGNVWITLLSRRTESYSQLVWYMFRRNLRQDIGTKNRAYRPRLSHFLSAIGKYDCSENVWKNVAGFNNDLFVYFRKDWNFTSRSYRTALRRSEEIRNRIDNLSRRTSAGRSETTRLFRKSYACPWKFLNHENNENEKGKRFVFWFVAERGKKCEDKSESNLSADKRKTRLLEGTKAKPKRK